MPLRVLIVDDEPLARDCVRLALCAAPDVEVVAECGDGIAAAAAIRALAPELVYLDVQMPGAGGFAVIEEIGAAVMPPVIFVTAYEEHALRAFAVHALDYLLKPFSDARFHESLAHARAQLSGGGGSLARRLEALLRERQDGAAPRRPGWLTVAERSGKRLVRIEDVDWFAAEGNYVRVYAGAEEHLLRMSLAALQQELDPARFVRIHRSLIVHLARVQRVEPWAGGDYLAILHDGRQLRVSRHYKDALLQPLL